jgi:phosphohistidine phosphatase
VRAVKVISAYIEEQGITPDLVLSSTSRRTRETLEGLGLRSATMIEHRLYGASSDDLLERLHVVPEEMRSVMIIGHNPALQMLTLRLARTEREGRPEGAEGLVEIRRKLPTGALVTLEVAEPWAELAGGGAQLIDYVRPKALQFP